MNDNSNFDQARRERRIAEQAASWYIEQRDALSERQRAAFLTWLRASPDHVREYLAIAQMHGDLKVAASMETLSADELVERVGRANPVVMFPRMDLTADQPPERVSHRWRGRWPMAAGIAALAAVMVLVLLTGMRWREAHSETLQSFAAGADEVRSIRLSDGTVVQLDRNSRIDVRFNAYGRRIEVVRGNALFDVGKDPARPLLVNVGDHVLQDIGTVFDVKRDSEGDQLTVINGRVRVWNAPPAVPMNALDRLGALGAGGNAVADLVAGQQIALGAVNVGPVTPAEIAKVTAWLPADIRFQHETVAEVARRFNAYTSTPLTIEDAGIAQMRISGVFHANNPQAFVAYLATLPGVRVVSDNARVRIIASASKRDEHVPRL